MVGNSLTMTRSLAPCGPTSTVSKRPEACNRWNPSLSSPPVTLSPGVTPRVERMEAVSMRVLPCTSKVWNR